MTPPQGSGERSGLRGRRPEKPLHPFGSLLVADGLITDEALVDALAEQARTGHSLSRVLVERNLVREAELVTILARHLGLDFVDLAEVALDVSALQLVPENLARRYQAVPVGFDGGRLVLAMADPGNIVAIDDIRTVSGREVRVVVSTRSAIQAAIERHHSSDGNAADISAQASRELAAEEGLANIREVVEDAPVVRLVNLMITQAVTERASDIHVEPGEAEVRVRYRIDGVLHEAMHFQRNVHSGVVSRLKVMADLDIAERRVPQDGRVSATIAGRPVDLRIATLPTVYGEKVVMRILDKSAALRRLPELGFMPEALERYASCFRKPYGTILVTGPTGSGKSTTLYATLHTIHDVARNVITVEDPVEYRLAGINQVQVNVRAGLTFAAALRSILRSDPDIVLVGEIRDAQTAKIAIEAALTGHLVLSTLHTNDAASTPNRLVDMGIEPFLVASALDCIVAQRLARRLCDRCKAAHAPTPEELRATCWEGSAADLPGVLFTHVGCEACARTGYRGRFAIHEVLVVDEEVERLIVDRGHTEQVRAAAVAQGMQTLRQTGLAHAAAGHTSLEEVLRVVA